MGVALKIGADYSDAIAITVCPTAKRSKAIVQRAAPVESAIPFRTETALTAPKSESAIPPAKDDRRSAQERFEAAERERARSVVLAQPHRRGSEDPMAGDALWETCRRLRVRKELYEAGDRYGEIVRQDRAAMGLHVPGLSRGEGDGLDLTEAQQEAIRSAAKLKRERANAELLGIMQRAPRVLERLCYDRLPPSPYDDDVIRSGLLRLAVHFGMLKLGINAEKNI